MMLYSEISGLTAKEIVKKKKELQTEMFDARMKNTLGQLPNQMVIREARKDIARLNTAMTLLAKKAGETTKAAAPKKAAAAKPAAKAGKKPAAKKAPAKASKAKKG
jgi:ribosomal protein L29